MVSIDIPRVTRLFDNKGQYVGLKGWVRYILDTFFIIRIEYVISNIIIVVIIINKYQSQNMNIDPFFITA